ncbi:uncharacterized protein LOC101857660 isoform X2 [Aplysia californica]|nr:uncharacterized protein LOC101857660 isoform X2 [Aplysia californica]XP_005104032.1 uncharacterized protein LOC101857660 isoform X2 [Aplysia californica]
MPGQQLEAPVSFSHENCKDFLSALLEERNNTMTQLKIDAESALDQSGSELYFSVSQKFLERKKAIQECIEKIRKNIKTKEKDAEALSRPDDQAKWKLMEMDIQYLRTFKYLARKELAKEDDVKKQALEIFMSRFANTEVQPETPDE